jgi:hypothetical protein
MTATTSEKRLNGTQLITARAISFWIGLPALSLVLYGVLVFFAVMSASPAAIIAYGVSPALVVPEERLLPAPFVANIAAWRIETAGPEFRSELLSDSTLTLATPFLLRSDTSRSAEESTKAATRIAESLLSAGVPLDKRNFLGCSALQVAAQLGDGDLYRFLVRNGVNVNEEGTSEARDPQCRKPAKEIGKVS